MKRTAWWQVGASLVAAALMAACGGPEAPAPATPAASAPSTAAPAAPTVSGYPEVPRPQDEWANKVGDLERDLQSLSSGHASAARDFADDLDSMFETEEIKPTRASLDALGRDLAAVLPSASNGAALQPRLAELMFVATRRAPLGDERLAQLERDVASALTAHAVPAVRAGAIARQVAAIARESRRPA